MLACGTERLPLRSYEIPPRVPPEGDSGYLEELTKAIFRAGFSWRVVRQKWDSFRESFDGFDPQTVAGYGAEKINQLFDDSAIIRNRRKILATIGNAETMLVLAREHGSFHKYLRSLDGLDYYERVKALTGEFAGLGRTGAFVFLHCVDEETPSWDER